MIGREPDLGPAGADLARALFQEAGDALLIVEPRSERLLDVNPMALRLTRLPREELLRLSYRDVVHHSQGSEEWLETVRQTILFHGQDGFLLRTDKPDVWTPVSVSISRLHMPDADALALFTIRDRSEQMAAWKRLHRTESELRRVLVSVSDCLWSCRIEPGGGWQYRYLSPVVQRLTGYPVGFFLENARGWEQVVEPEDLPRWRTFLARAAAGTNGEIEYRIQRADGATVWVRESVTAAPTTEPPGTLLLHGVLTDVTERRRAEQVTLERNLLQKQKLESLGVLAGGIAHDFNNLLTGILGNASLARMACQPEDAPTRNLEQIETLALRAADLCKQMLAFAGKGPFLFAPIDLNAVIQETVEPLRRSLSPTAVLTLGLAADLSPVLADSAQLRQVILKLVQNSSEALGARAGRIRMATGSVRLGRGALRDEPTGEVPEGEYVVLEVSDDGPGMSPEVRARMFEPFFSTRFAGRGLGLAVVLGVVRAHKGGLRVRTSPGAGTAVAVYLPRAVGVAPTPSPASEDWRGSGTVLVADDEEHVRTVARRLLEQAGFTVVVARDGREAVELFAARSGEIRLVLLDLTMPRLDGEQTLRELRRLQPDVRVVLMSGYAEPEVTARFAGQKPSGFVQKPFRATDLFAALRRALEG